MELRIKTNHLAIVSVAAGLIALLITLYTIFLLISLANMTSGAMTDSPAFSEVGIFNSWLGRSAGLSGFGAIVTGSLALLEIRRKGGAEKGSLLAWAGIVIGSSWILFRLGVALFFILALIPVR